MMSALSTFRQPFSNASRRLSTLAVSLAIICALAYAAAPSEYAYADVRADDVIMGETVSERDLAISQCPSISAEYACLIGADGTVYFERNSHSPAQIASITKIMTAIVALENAAPDTIVGVSETAALIGESTAGLQEGDSMPLEEALKALLVPSGNDAAQAIAETVGAQMMASDPSLGSDPVQVFVDAMNKKAAELGCSDTLYENPHGLDDGDFAGSLHSTASDQAKVAQCAMKDPTIRSIVAGGNTTITVLREGDEVDIDLETTDLLLDIYEYAIGIKTGFTEAAGASFAGAANKDGFELYAIVLNSSDEVQRFGDASNLFEWAYEHMTQVPLANSSQTTESHVEGLPSSVPLIAAVSHADWIDKTVPATLADPDATIAIFDVDGNINARYEFLELHGDVHAGDKVGTVTFTQHGNVVAQQDLVACDDVPAPNFFDGVGVWWTRLVGGLDGPAGRADDEVYNVMPIIINYVSNAA